VAIFLTLSAQTPLDVAQKALQAKDYAEAAKQLQQHLATHNDDVRAWFNLAYAQTMTGESAAAIDAYEKTLALDSKLFQAHLNLSILLLDAGRVKDALPHLAAAVEAQPKNARACLLYAQGLLRAGDRAGARREFDNTLALDPQSAAALRGSGRLAIEEKNFPLAERQLAKALELDPKDASVLLDLGDLAAGAGDRAKAAAHYGRYVESNPTAAPVHRRLGGLYLEQKKTEPAIAEFEQAAKLAPAPEDDWNLGRAHAAAKKPDQAIPYLQRFRLAQPSNFDAALLLGQLLTQKRQFVSAQAALMDAIRLQPQVPDSYVDLANCLYLEERYQDTLAVLDRMAKLQIKETPWSTFLRAISLDKLGFVQPALDSYKRFLALDSSPYPDQQFQARQRIKVLTLVLEKGGKRRPK
jgi:tetratricopeptide (TPR) repeat protein